MARVPQVTRTIPTTDVKFLAVNIELRETYEQVITLPRTYKDEDKMMKALEKVLAGEPIKAVSIISYEVRETLYGMTEAEFIKHAQVLPPRDKKEE